MTPLPARAGDDREEGTDGFALLMVLLFLLAVTAIIAPLVLGARTDFVVASNRLQQDRLEALANGLLVVLARNLAAPPLEARNEGIKVRSEPLRCQSDRYRIEARIQDQRGLIGINTAAPDLLAAGFEALGFSTGDSREMVEALVAYRTAPPTDGQRDDGGAQPPPLQPSADAGDRINGGLKQKPFEAIEELYDFNGFRGRPVRELAEVFSVQNTLDTIVGPRLSTRLATVLPTTASPSRPYVLGQVEDGAKTYRIDVEVRSLDGGVSGYSGAIVVASEGDQGDFQLGERITNPEFLDQPQDDFSGAVDCSIIFGVGVVAALSADS